jgi:peptidoglycan/LPS O-acetylase OafA/YrhL
VLDAPIAPARNPADDVICAAMRHWRLVALIAAAVTLLAWLAVGLQPKRYRASSLATINPLTAELSSSDLIRGIDTLDRRVVVASVAALASAPVIVNGAGGGHGYEINAVVLPNTSLFRVEVEGNDPKTAAAIANKVPLLLGIQSRTIYKLYGVMLVSPATPSEEAVLPRVGRAVAAGLVFGVLLGIAVAWLLDRRPFART